MYQFKIWFLIGYQAKSRCFSLSSSNKKAFTIYNLKIHFTIDYQYKSLHLFAPNYQSIGVLCSAHPCKIHIVPINAKVNFTKLFNSETESFCSAYKIKWKGQYSCAFQFQIRFSKPKNRPVKYLWKTLSRKM